MISVIKKCLFVGSKLITKISLYQLKQRSKKVLPNHLKQNDVSGQSKHTVLTQAFQTIKEGHNNTDQSKLEEFFFGIDHEKIE